MNLAGVYRSVARVAATVVSGAGMPAEYVSYGEGEYDPLSGRTQRETTAYQVRIVMEPIAARLVDGSAVQAGDQWALVAADSLAVEPTTAGKLRIGGVDWQIVAVRALNPGGTPLTYQLQVRR